MTGIEQSEPCQCQIGRSYGDGYRIEQLLARGGMAEVYTARHELTDRVVAFKVLNRRYWKNDDIVRRARIEAKALARIDHPSVVRIFHAGDDAEVGLYIVMELLGGKSLRAIMHRAGKLPIKEALALAIELCEATHRLHELGIFHRDIKPDNVIIVPEGTRMRLKLLDLGAAKVKNLQERSTAHDRTVGTARYMSPEHIQQGLISPASDQYSVAHMLFEMLCGRSPLGGDHPHPSHFDFCAWHLFGEPAPLTEMLPSAPQRLSLVLGQAMRKVPGERYASMLAFADDLQAVLALLAAAPPTISPQSEAWLAGAGERPGKAAHEPGGNATAPPRPAHEGNKPRTGLGGTALMEQPVGLAIAATMPALADAAAAADADAPGTPTVEAAPSPAALSAANAHAWLVLETSSDPTFLGRRRFAVGTDAVTVGWDTSAALPIDDPLLVGEPLTIRWSVEDGCYLLEPGHACVIHNGAALDQGVRVELHGDAIIAVGGSILSFALEEERVGKAEKASLFDPGRVFDLEKRRKQDREHAARTPLWLTVSEGRGAPRELPAAPLTLGSSERSGLVLDVEGVAPLQAVIAPWKGALTIFRARTAGGMVVNGKRVDVAALSGGDRIELGPVAMRVTREPLPATSSLAAAARAEPERPLPVVPYERTAPSPGPPPAAMAAAARSTGRTLSNAALSRSAAVHRPEAPVGRASAGRGWLGPLAAVGGLGLIAVALYLVLSRALGPSEEADAEPVRIAPAAQEDPTPAPEPAAAPASGTEPSAGEPPAVSVASAAPPPPPVATPQAPPRLPAPPRTTSPPPAPTPSPTRTGHKPMFER